MEVQSQIEDNIGIFSFYGTFNTASLSQTELTIQTFIRQNNGLSGIIFDFDQVLRLKSTGIGFTISMFKDFKSQNKKFAVCHLSSNSQEMLQSTRLSRIIDIYPTVEEALQEMTQ